jgi:hypothetical protein
MATRRVGVVTVLVLALGLAACASTRVVNQWRNPAYAAPGFQRIVVVGISTQPSLRRTFEDEFVARLREAGQDAVPSYRVLPEEGQVEEARLREAVRQAGADGVIVTRLVRVDREARVSPGYYRPAPPLGFGLYDVYSAAWFGYYEPPTVYQYDVYTFETTLHDARTNTVVWTGTLQTTSPRDIGKEIRRYVGTVIDALRSQNILVA